MRAMQVLIILMKYAIKSLTGLLLTGYQIQLMA